MTTPDPAPYFWTGRSSSHDDPNADGEGWIAEYRPRGSQFEALVPTAELSGAAAEMSFDEWARIGLLRGWAGPPVCSTHDGIPSSAEEEEQFEEGYDPCVHVMRLYEEPEVRVAVESNHAPSQWRKPLEERG